MAFKILDKIFGSMLILGAILVTGVPNFSFIVRSTKAMDKLTPFSAAWALYSLKSSIQEDLILLTTTPSAIFS